MMRRSLRCLLPALCLACAGAPAFAGDTGAVQQTGSARTAGIEQAGNTGNAIPTQAPPVPKHSAEALQQRLGGMITDQTITSAGKDFYQAFSAMWHDMPFNERFSIAVRERPSARMGNRIQVEYANRTIFEAVLPAARGNIPAISARAAEIAYQNVSAAEAQRLLFRDQDLAGDEF